MFEVGKTSIKAKKLVSTTYASMMKAIESLNQNTFLGDIGSTIQTYVEKEGNVVVVTDETAAEAKANKEAERTAKVQGQIDRAAANASGIPW